VWEFFCVMSARGQTLRRHGGGGERNRDLWDKWILPGPTYYTINNFTRDRSGREGKKHPERESGQPVTRAVEGGTKATRPVGVPGSWRTRSGGDMS